MITFKDLLQVLLMSLGGILIFIACAFIFYCFITGGV